MAGRAGSEGFLNPEKINASPDLIPRNQASLSAGLAGGIKMDITPALRQVLKKIRATHKNYYRQFVLRIDENGNVAEVLAVSGPLQEGWTTTFDDRDFSDDVDEGEIAFWFDYNGDPFLSYDRLIEALDEQLYYYFDNQSKQAEDLLWS